LTQYIIAGKQEMKSMATLKWEKNMETGKAQFRQEKKKSDVFANLRSYRGMDD